MQPFLELLKRCAENHTFDSGDPDCKTVLDQLFCAYQDSHKTDPPEIKEGFKELDTYLRQLSLDDNNAAWNLCCRICTAYEHKAFIDGFHYGSTTQQNYDSVKAQRDASKAQYDLAKLQVDYTLVKAPVEGTVLMADGAVGSVASQTQPIAVLADLNNQVVRLSVPEKYYDLFSLEKENLIVSVTRPAEKNMYDDAVTSATIENIAPYIAAQSKTFQVVCHLDNPGERFRPGMYVKVLITYKNYVDVPVLPMKTKKMDGSLYIYHPESKTVEFIPPAEYATDNEYFIVPEKYKDTFFVVDGQNSLFDGQQVRIFDEVIGEY